MVNSAKITIPTTTYGSCKTVNTATTKRIVVIKLAVMQSPRTRWSFGKVLINTRFRKPAKTIVSPEPANHKASISNSLRHAVKAIWTTPSAIARKATFYN
jgi:hypothetical protein